MTAKSFFKKVGRGLQSGAGNLTNAAGKAAGSVLGKQQQPTQLKPPPLY